MPFALIISLFFGIILSVPIYRFASDHKKICLFVMFGLLTVSILCIAVAPDTHGLMRFAVSVLYCSTMIWTVSIYLMSENWLGERRHRAELNKSLNRPLEEKIAEANREIAYHQSIIDTWMSLKRSYEGMDRVQDAIESKKAVKIYDDEHPFD